jgi:hypothetical protein
MRSQVIGPIAKQCGTGAAVLVFGFSFHIFRAGEILISLVLSAIVILLPAMMMLSAFLIWQGCKRITASRRPAAVNSGAEGLSLSVKPLPVC